MTHILLLHDPPIANALRLDRSVVAAGLIGPGGEALADLPAGDPALSMPGVAAGMLLVSCCAGFYITPAMVGAGARSRSPC